MALPFLRRNFDGIPGFGIGSPDRNDNLSGRMCGLLNSVFGQGSIAIAAASAVVDVDPALHGRPLTASLNGVVATGVGDATATTLLNAAWHATVLGRFTVTANANATALTSFSYHIDAPIAT